MICPLSMRLAGFSTKILLPLLFLCSCASIGETLYPAPSENAQVVKQEKRRKVTSSRYIWAVQNYEAGLYSKAISQLKSLRKEGPDLENYEFIPFYLGMSHYQLKQYPQALEQLELFLQSRSPERETQEAKLTVLSIYERTAQWDKLLGLAVELDKLSLFQDNRAHLKLVWARALREKGELRSAKATLKEAFNYLDNQEFGKNRSSDPEMDLWGRFHRTDLLLQLDDCKNLQPKEVGKKTLFEPWLSASVDCFRKSLRFYSNELLVPESSWAEAATGDVINALDQFGQRVITFQNSKPLALKRQIEKEARQNLYRLLSQVDEDIKSLKNQTINSDSLLQVRKKLDLLLVSFPNPS